MNFRFRELVWLAPLVFLGLVSLALLRPRPVLPPRAIAGKTITIKDGQYNAVEVPSPPQGVADAFLFSYLPQTKATKLWLRVGHPRDREKFSKMLLGRIFPELLADKYWSNSPGNFESLLASSKPGNLYFLNTPYSFGYTAQELREMGMTAVVVMPTPAYPEPPASWQVNDDEHRMLTGIRVMNAALGQDAFGDEVIAEYLRSMAQFRAELKPETIPMAERPRVAGVGAPVNNWARVAVSSDDNPRLATRGVLREFAASGRQQDAERLLAMDPDIIGLWGGTPESFYQDRRWRGLKVVRERRAYNGHFDFGRYIHDVDTLPLANRLSAEIYHPSRLAVGELRGRIREHYRKRYNYEMSEDLVDELLRIDVNSGSAGYARFRREAVVG
jgi:hypothetical protein